MKFVLRISIVLAATLFLAWLAIARPFVFPGKTVSISGQVNTEELRQYVEKISSEFSPRDWMHEGNLAALAQFIRGEFSESSESVALQPFAAAGRQYANVIAEYGNLNAEEVFVVGAHYDAFAEFPGADDNASGVAALLALGKLLSGKELPFKVLLVAYALEEPPFFKTENMGSAVHAVSLAAAGTKVRLMISLETIGYFSDEPDSQKYPVAALYLLYPSRGNFIALVGDLLQGFATIDLKKAFVKIRVSSRKINQRPPAVVPGIDYSDHMNYWKYGFDAVMITDTAFLRNSEYHKPGDTPDRLDYDKMSQVVLGTYSYLMQMSKE